jgi:SsrA-binding protein
MTAKKKKAPDAEPFRRIAENRKARFRYAIEDTLEAGIALTGTEVKSLRTQAPTIAEAYAEVRGGEVWLVNCHIPEFSHGNRMNHEPRRPRRLLLHRRQIDRLGAKVVREGYTLIPLRLYFNAKNRAKVTLALGKGKKLHDKREAEQKRDWERSRRRLLRDKG